MSVPAEAARLFREVQADYEKIAGPGTHPLNAPASPGDVAAWEASVGYRLPQDVRQIYTEVSNGEPGPFGLLDSHCLLTLEQSVQIHEALKNSPVTVGQEHGVVRHSWPYDTIARVSWSPGWVPIAGTSRRYFAIDLTPGPQGTYGQIIDVWPDDGVDPGGTHLVASSLTELLRVVQQRLRGEELIDFLVHEDEVHGPFLTYENWPPLVERPWQDQQSRPELDERWQQTWSEPRPWRGVQTDRSHDRPGAWAAGDLVVGERVSTLTPLEFYPHVQTARLTVAAGTDLTPFSHLEHLLELFLIGADRPSRLDLSPLGGTPAEVVMLKDLEIDPTPLTALPALRTLALVNCTLTAALPDLAVEEVLDHDPWGRI